MASQKVVTRTDRYGNVKVVSGSTATPSQKYAQVAVSRAIEQAGGGNYDLSKRGDITTLAKRLGVDYSIMRDKDDVILAKIQAKINSGNATISPSANMSIEQGTAFADQTGQISIVRANQSSLQPNISTEQGEGFAMFIPPEQTLMSMRRQPDGSIDTRGRIQAASKAESIALARERNVISRSADAFFRQMGLIAPRPGYTLGEELRTAKGLEAVAATGGQVAGIYSLSKVPAGGKAVLTGAKVAAQTAPGRVFFSTPGRTIFGLGSVFGAKPIAETVSRKTATVEQQNIMKTSQFSESVKSARRREESEVSKGIIKSIAQNLPGVSYALGRREFEIAAREELRMRGFQGKQLDQAVNAAIRQRKALETAEFVGTLGTAALSEQIGGRLVATTFRMFPKTVPKTKLAGSLFMRSFPGIATAGTFEGASQEILQQQTRLQERNLKNVAFMGLFGAGSAGIIGGGIVATSVTKPRVSKVLNIGANIADPFEKPGDILAGVGSSIENRLFGIRKPVVTISGPPQKKQEMFNLAGSNKRKTQTKPKTIAESLGFKKAKTIPITSRVPVFNIGRQPTVPIPTTTKTPVTTTTDTPTTITTPLPVSTNINIFSPVETPTQTPVPVPISIPIPIPTPTPILRVPPPIPLPFGAIPRGYGGGSGGKGRKRVINELEAGRQFLANILGTGTQRLSPARPSGKKRTGYNQQGSPRRPVGKIKRRKR